MKNIRSEFLVKLIASLCIVISFLGIGVNNRVFAAGMDDEEVFGGVLLTPVTRLITAFADGAMDILHSATLNQDSTIIRLDAKADSWWQNWGRVVFALIAGIGIAITIITLTIGTGGFAAAIAAASSKLIGTIFVIKTVATAGMVGVAVFGSWVIVGEVLDTTMMDDDICIPVFNLTPEEIFSNKIWIFDVNFFEPEQDKGFYLTEINDNDLSGKEIAKEIGGNGERLVGAGKYEYDELHSFFEEKKEVGSRLAIDNNTDSKILDIILKVNEKLKEIPRPQIDHNNKYEMIIESVSEDPPGNDSIEYHTEKRIEFKIYNKEKSQEYIKVTYVEKTDNIYDVQSNLATKIIHEEIMIKMLNDVSEEEITEASRVESIATTLRGVISKWYFILRNLALLVLMLLLIYSGIRIVIGSTAGEKAKYKERLQDWLVGMCLVFLMHYIMVFAVELNEKFINLIDSSNGNQGIYKVIHLSTQNQINEAKKHEQLEGYIYTGSQLGLTNNSNQYLLWPTNLMGGIRIQQQLVNEGTVNWIGYALCYVVLVVYTVSFTWTYLRRVLYMAFLTMIAPLVAMTYPLDKLTDGKAQAFNAWLKEYIFNLLIQPFHLLLYTVLVTSAFELVGQNSLYALVAIGFMTPAEKLLRKFFGFEKAQTPGLLGGAAGAALAMSGLQKVIAFGDKGKNPEQEEESDKDDIKFSSSNAVSAKAVMASNQITDVPHSGSENEGDGGDGAQFDNQVSTGGNGFNIFTPPASDTRLGNTTLQTNGIDIAMGANATASGVAGENGIRTDVSANGDSAVEGGEVTEAVGARRRIEGDGLIDRKKGQKGVIRSAIGSYNRLQGQKMYKRMKKARPIRALARGATGLFGGALFGMAGLALGIASGDPSKAFQYTTAGATGGFAVGKGIAGKVVDAASVNTKKLSDEISVAYYGEDYKNQKLKQEKENLKRNEDYIMYLRKTFGVSREGAIDILDTTGADCLDSGITEIEDIAAQHLLVAEFMEDQKNQELELKEDEWADRLLTGELNSEFGLNGDEFNLTPEEQERAEQEAKESVADDKRKLDADKEAAEKKYNADIKKMQDEVAKQAEEKLIKDDESIRKEAENNKSDQINKMRKDEYNSQIERSIEYQKDCEALDALLNEANTEEEREKIRNERAKRDIVYEEEKRKAQNNLEQGIKSLIENEAKDIKDRKREEIKKKLEGEAKVEIDTEKQKSDETLKKRETALENKKKELEEKNMAAIRKGKAKAYALGNARIQREIEAERERFEKSVRERDEEYQARRKDAFEQAIVMKKFSDRTPDFSKMTEKKIQSYRDRFKIEMKEEIKKQLKARGMTEADAEKEAEARSGTAADQIIQGIIRYDTTKSRLLEV